MAYRTEQDKVNRKEANQRYYKLEENKQQKRDYMKEYQKQIQKKNQMKYNKQLNYQKHKIQMKYQKIMNYNKQLNYQLKNKLRQIMIFTHHLHLMVMNSKVMIKEMDIIYKKLKSQIHKKFKIKKKINNKLLKLKKNKKQH